MADTIRIGAEGESAAVDYLRANGFLIVERNWRSHPHEIDIIASKDGALRFIEVKTRKLGSLTSPEEAVNRKKINNLVAAVNHYVALYDVKEEVWLDLAAVDALPEGHFEVRYIPDIANLNW